MDALKQYTDLYDSHREALDSGSAGVLNTLRPNAREALEGKKLPRKGQEGYEKTSVNDMFAPDLGVNIARVNLPVDLARSFKCDVPNISTLLAVVANDHFVPTESLLRNLPQGLTVCSLAQAAALHPELVEPYYARIAPLCDTPVALNTMLAQDGVFVHVAKGVKIEKALQVVNIFNSPTPLMAARRVLIVLEEGASLQMLMCDHTADSERQYLSSQVVEVMLHPHASLHLYDIEESSERTSRMWQLFATQRPHSLLNFTGATLTCGTTRNEYFVNVEGDECHTQLASMGIGSDHMHIDNASEVVHSGQRSHSNQLFKYVLDDSASAAFEGSITVTPTGRFTEAYQSNRNVLASPEARVHTKPRLLIFNDDVKCSHGATTGQLDQQALFYMRSRGIPQKQARTMLMQAFMTDVIATVALESLRDRLTHLVENRFAGHLASCSSCAHACRSSIKSTPHQQ